MIPGLAKKIRNRALEEEEEKLRNWEESLTQGNFRKTEVVNPIYLDRADLTQPRKEKEILVTNDRDGVTHLHEERSKFLDSFDQEITSENPFVGHCKVCLACLSLKSVCGICANGLCNRPLCQKHAWYIGKNSKTPKCYCRFHYLVHILFVCLVFMLSWFYHFLMKDKDFRNR